jgi:FAD/FMN-containing dehydrogenase
MISKGPPEPNLGVLVLDDDIPSYQHSRVITDNYWDDSNTTIHEYSTHSKRIWQVATKIVHFVAYVSLGITMLFALFAFPKQLTEPILQQTPELSLRDALFVDSQGLTVSVFTGNQVIRQHLFQLRAQMNGTVVFPNAEGYDGAATAWVRHAALEPLLLEDTDAIGVVVIEAQNEHDVQLALPVLSFLHRNYQFPFRIRSGGHHKMGYSSFADGRASGKDGAILSLSAMNRIAIPPYLYDRHEDDGTTSSIITIEPAVLVRNVLQQLTKPLGYGGVIGFCGSVAEAGFILGGGFGLQSRLYGLGLDSVESFRVVLADGRLIVASPTEHADLFWALRGAGSGSFGVVTAMEYRVHPVCDTAYFLQLRMSNPEDTAHFLHQIGKMDSELPGNVLVMHDEMDIINLSWSGRSESDIQNGDVFLHDLVQSLMGSSQRPLDIQQMAYSWSDTFGANATTTNNNWNWGDSVWAAACWTGFLLPENNTAEVWSHIMRQMNAGLQDSQPYLLPDIEFWGGAISQVPSNSTAFPYRSAVYNVGILLIIPVNETNAAAVFEEETKKIDLWWYKIDQYLSGSYVNYPMASLLNHSDTKHYAKMYWGENLPRLVKIKQRYDPDNFFQFPMSVPLNL